jgi:DNA-binding NtrC family response regulator
VRIVAATNRDLEADVAAGRFRGDLLYRLNVVPIVLPPLRERRDEIVPLARHFLRPGLTLSDEAVENLRDWSWPGNVRELQNLMQRVALFCDGKIVDGEVVQRWLQPGAAPKETTVVLQPFDVFARLIGRPRAEVEQQLVRRTLSHWGGNRTRTAELLGIGVRTLYNKLQDEKPAIAGVGKK